MTPEEKRTAQAVFARQEFAKMRKSLASWLYWKRLNEGIANGIIAAKVPATQMRAALDTMDKTGEKVLGGKIRALLSEIIDPAVFDLNVLDTEALADIVVTGRVPSLAAGAQAQGIAPLILIGGILAGGLALSWSISSKIKGDAAIEAEKQKGLSCRAVKTWEACGGPPPWIKWIAVGGAAWLLLGGEAKHWLGLTREKARRSRAHKYLET